MNKVNQILEEKVMPIAGRIAGQRHLQALRDGIILTMPLIIIGSFFLIIGNLPIPGYAEFMAKTFGSSWSEKLAYPVDATFEIMGLVAAFGIAYRLAEKYGVDALSAGAISLAAFLLATPYQVPFMPDGATKEIMVGGGIPLSLMGSKGSICRHDYRNGVHRDLPPYYPAQFSLQNAGRCSAGGKQVICRVNPRLCRHLPNLGSPADC